MKKNYLLVLLFMAMATFISAKQVDVAYAMQVAKNFYLQNTGLSSGSVTLTLSYACTTNSNVGRSSDGRTVYYAFNVSDNKGFVIVSGEDLVQPILGYNTKGNFSGAAMPPPVKAWMGKYKMEIVYVIENVSQTTDAIKNQWLNYYNNIPVYTGPSRSTQAINPLVQTTWNQSPYYNNMCPYDNTASAFCVTGCVATAMAQIMRFWSYPSVGTGSHSYNTQNYGTLSANYGATTYNWANMALSINSDNTDIETLMSHCGISVDMNYSPQESGAWVITADANGGQCAQTSYVNYFGYNGDSIKGLARANYSDQDWTNIILNDLSLGRPVEYVGSGPGGGHTWVCDGTDVNGNFHMNWGWGSQDDGYYPLNALNPATPGVGGGSGDFNSNEEVVVGIVPKNHTGGGGGGGTVNQDSIVITATVSPSVNPVAQNAPFTVTTTITNAGNTSFTGDFTAALFNSDGVFNGFIQTFPGRTLTAQTSYTASFYIDSMTVIPGLYYVGIYYRNGTNSYSLINPTTFTNPITINVTTPYNDIQMYSVDTITPAVPMVNQAFNIRVDISNVGTSNFTGYVNASLYKMDGSFVDTINTVTSSMQSGYFYYFNFHTAGLNVPAGTYYIAFWSSVDQVNWNLIYDLNFHNPVQVTIVSQPLSPDRYEPDNTEATAYTLPVTFTGNTASVNTAGSNIHVGNDYDYYKINLPAGTNYSVSPHLEDSRTDSFTYTNDVVFSYKVNSSAWSDVYQIASGPVFVQNGGTVIFYVSDDFLGTIGTYQLDIDIVSGPNVGINETALNEVRVFPNPVSGVLSVDAGEATGEYEMQIFNTVGEVTLQTTGTLNGQLLKADASKFASGMYVLQLKTSAGIVNTKFIVK